jgi:hypothetical protein
LLKFPPETRPAVDFALWSATRHAPDKQVLGSHGTNCDIDQSLDGESE